MKKFIKNNKGLLIAIGVVVLLIILILLSSLANKPELIITEDTESWVESINNDEYAITVLALSYCSHCHNLQPIISDVANKNNIPLYWVEMDVVSNEDAQVYSSAFDFSEYDGSSPYIALTSKGKVLGQTVGEMPKEDVEAFLRQKGAIK